MILGIVNKLCYPPAMNYQEAFSLFEKMITTAVATQAFGGQVYDDTGELLRLNEYIILPGTGATITKGEKFQFVIDKL